MKPKEQIIEVPLAQIKIIEGFNLRQDFEDTEDLENSMKATNGNLSPIGVCLVEKDYQLLYGERRFKVAQKLGFATMRCLLYEPKDEYERFMIMFHENIGRKDLKWVEEVKALKMWHNFEIKRGKTIEQIIETEADRKKKSKRTVWRLLETLKAIEEFPQLETEKKKTNALKKYNALKRLDETQINLIKSGKLTIEKALKKENVLKKVRGIEGEKAVIEELKKDIEHYKAELARSLEEIKANIHDILAEMSQEERIKEGVWLTDEVKRIVASARQCSGFGLLDPGEGDECNCENCKEKYPEDYARCNWWHENFEETKKIET